MPTPTFQPLGGEPSTQQIQDYIIKLIRDLNFMLENLDNKNVVNVAGFRATETELMSKNQMVGMSSDGVDPTSIRFWAGDVKTGTPNFKVTQAGILTAIAALFMSALGFPRVKLDPSNNTFSIDQSATSSIVFNPNHLGTTPVINFHYGTIDGYIGYFNALARFVITSPDGVDIELSNGGTSGDISLRPVNNLNVPNWSEIINDTTSQSLQAALNAKANVFTGYTGSFSTGTQTVNVSNGIITSVV